MSTSIERTSKVSWVVHTDLPPEWVDRIGLEVFRRWMEFATGGAAAGSRQIVHPTGKYAASIQYQKLGEATVAIVADASMAPEAAILETGHGSVDLKTKLRLGVYPMHGDRPNPMNGPVPGYFLTGRGSHGQPAAAKAVMASPVTSRKSMWASMRKANATGFATLSPNSPAGSWIIPPMAAYAPAHTLAMMAAAQARKAG